MPFKRLEKGNAAAVIEDKSGPQDGVLWKDAILVHEGAFDSQDGAIEFDEPRLKRVAANMNAQFDDLEKEYGGVAPMGAYPPLLDSHSDDSNGRMLGRLRGPFKVERRKVPKVGDDVACLVAKLAFLGAAAHEAVNDGRIYHLSIGINEETDLLGELSAVIDPAATGAMLLGKGKKSAGALVEPPPLNNNKMRGNSMSKRLKKRLAAHKARLTAIKGLLGDAEKMTQLAGATKSATVHLIAEGKVRTRLSALVKGGKLTPAELKKMDFKKLSAMKPEDLDMCMGVLEAREPVIEPGQRGSKDAVNASDLRANAKEEDFKRLKTEARQDVYKKLGKKLPESEDKRLAAKKMGMDEKVESKMGSAEESPDKKRMAEYAKCVSELAAAVDGGDKEISKKHLAALSAFGDDGHKMGLGDPMAGSVDGMVGAEKAQQGIQEQIDALNVNLSKVVDCLKHLLVEEEAEGHDLADEEAEMGAGGEGGAAAAAEGKPVPEPGEKKPPVKEEKAE